MIVSVFGKIDTESAIGASVKSAEETLDSEFGTKFKV
jgi:hypothetical protein